LGKNRDRVSLIAAILSTAGSGSSKTHIMFGANLSFKLLEKYLETTRKLGFLQLNGTTYNVTSDGNNFLKQYLSFQERYVKVQENLDEINNQRAHLEQLCSKFPESKEPNRVPFLNQIKTAIYD
jgi:predicted transcriptional regulator